MLRAISVGGYITIQGIFDKAFPDGRISVKDGDKIFIGMPVNSPQSSATH